MIQRIVTTAVVAAFGLLALGGRPALAQKYDYGRYSGGGGGDAGFYVYGEAMASNPRNTDNVVATSESGGVLSPFIPVWDSEFSGRLGFGYEWSNGNRVEASVWGYSTDSIGLDGGTAGSDILHFSVGPPLCSVNPCAGANGSPGFVNITTEITASTGDLTWARDVEVTDDLDMGISLGVRFASYEETAVGIYGDTANTNRFAASKSNEGTMFGARIAARASYRFVSSFSIGGSLGFSVLDGELEAFSGLTPASGQAVAPSFASAFDDSRSGLIRDLELKVTWHLLDDRLRLWGGWEQSAWEEIAADLMRNFPGSTVSLRDRDSVTFSSYKFGVYFHF